MISVDRLESMGTDHIPDIGPGCRKVKDWCLADSLSGLL